MFFLCLFKFSLISNFFSLTTFLFPFFLLPSLNAFHFHHLIFFFFYFLRLLSLTFSILYIFLLFYFPVFSVFLSLYIFHFYPRILFSVSSFRLRNYLLPSLDSIFRNLISRLIIIFSCLHVSGPHVCPHLIFSLLSFSASLLNFFLSLHYLLSPLY